MGSFVVQEMPIESKPEEVAAPKPEKGAAPKTGTEGNAKKKSAFESPILKEFEVTLVKTEDNPKIGVDIAHQQEGTYLRIKTIKEGLVQKWNETNPGDLIVAMDRILSVNG